MKQQLESRPRLLIVGHVDGRLAAVAMMAGAALVASIRHLLGEHEFLARRHCYSSRREEEGDRDRL